MQDDEHHDCPDVDADLAGTGHEREAPAPADGVEEGERRNADKADLARSEQNRIAAQESDFGLEPDEEYLDASLTQSARTVVRSIAYSGPLPPASEMNAYDDETRRHILEMHRLQIEHSIRQDDKITDEVIESDRQSSRREDLLVQADIDQSKKAQDKTFVIYVGLIIALAIAVFRGQQGAATAITTLIGGVSITNMFVSHKQHDTGTAGEPQKLEGEQQDGRDDTQ